MFKREYQTRVSWQCRRQLQFLCETTCARGSQLSIAIQPVNHGQATHTTYHQLSPPCTLSILGYTNTTAEQKNSVYKRKTKFQTNSDSKHINDNKNPPHTCSQTTIFACMRTFSFVHQQRGQHTTNLSRNNRQRDPRNAPR